MSTVAMPPGAVPLGATFMPDVAITRVTGFRFELLDEANRKIGDLDTATPGGGLEYHSTNSIKSGGSLDIYDPADVHRFDLDTKEIDWLHTRIRPLIQQEVAGSPETIPERPLGIFIPAAPQETNSHQSRSWSVELTDLLGELDRQKFLDQDGTPYNFVANEGDNILDLVSQIIEGAGESAATIGTGDETIQSDQIWEINDSKLKVCNDLLELAGYFSLVCDHSGQYRALPYVSPRQRDPVYSADRPLSDDERKSLMDPEWTRDRDYFDVPNIVIAVQQGDGDEEPIIVTSTNEDDNSPFSYQNRGKPGQEGQWYPYTMDNVEASSQAALQAQADMKLANLTGVVSSLSIKHLWLPDLTINSAVQFTNSKLGLDYLCYVVNTTIPFDPTALCESTIKEAVT